MKTKELTSVVGHTVNANNVFIGIDDEDNPVASGDNPFMFARVYKHQGNAWRFTVYENEAEYAVQDYDPAQPGFVDMNKDRAIALATEILNTRIARINSGEVEAGMGVGYIPG